MKTLAVVGTAGGVGTTTVAALAFAGLRDAPPGAPVLYGLQRSRVLERAGGDEVAALNGDLAIWDAGRHTPENAAALLEAGGCALVVAAPATPLGVADAARVLATVAELGEQALDGVTVVLSQVNGRGAPAPSRSLPQHLLVRLPWSAALATPGPVPRPSALGRAGRQAVEAWQRRARRLLLG